jgi:hypothetical protein
MTMRAAPDEVVERLGVTGLPKHWRAPPTH